MGVIPFNDLAFLQEKNPFHSTSHFFSQPKNLSLNDSKYFSFLLKYFQAIFFLIEMHIFFFTQLNINYYYFPSAIFSGEHTRDRLGELFYYPRYSTGASALKSYIPFVGERGLL